MQKKNALFILGMVLAWATYYAVSKWAVGVTGSAFNAGLILRISAFVFLTIYLISKREFLSLFKTGKAAFVLLTIGVLGFLLDTFANVGFQHGSVSTGTVLLKTDILMANVATVVFLKEKLYATDWLSTFVMLGGVICVMDIDFKNLSVNWYDLFFIASALAVTVNAFVIKGTQKKYDVSSDVIAYYNNFVVMLLFLISALISGDVFKLGGVSADWKFFLLVILGGLGQSLIYVFYYRNLKVFPVWQVKLFLLLVPVVSCFIGVFAFGESFGWLKVLGIVLVLIGAAGLVLRDKINKNKSVKISADTAETEGNDDKDN